MRANVFSIWSSCHLAEEEVGSVEQEGGVTLICHYGLSNPGQYKSVLYPYLVGQKPGATFICHCHSSWSCCEDSKLTLTLISTQFLISTNLVSTEFKLDVRIVVDNIRICEKSISWSNNGAVGFQPPEKLKMSLTCTRLNVSNPVIVREQLVDS